MATGKGIAKRLSDKTLSLAEALLLIKQHESTIKEQDDTINALHSEVNDLETYISDNALTLKSILREYGYPTDNNELKAVIGDISHIQVINPNKRYNALRLDNEYVIDLRPAHIIIEVAEYPDDYANGYWKYENGQWVLDKVKYSQMWGV